MATAPKKQDLVQTKNPRSGRYIKIDRAEGQILASKTTAGPYKGVAIAKMRKERARNSVEMLAANF